MKPEVPDYLKSKSQIQPANSRRVSRRRILIRLLAAISPPIFGALYAKFESNWLDLSQNKISFPGILKQQEILILHLSDLHLSKTFSLEKIDSALQDGFSASPDACFITGDFVTDIPSKAELEGLGKLLFKFSSKTPTYACLGNHDGGVWSSSKGGLESSNEIRTMLRKARVRLLLNEELKVKIKGTPLRIVGLGDLWSEQCFPKLCLSPLSKSSKKEPVILMCHNPDAKDILKSYHWNLMLSGHTHGGQFIVPFTKFAPFAPVADKSMIDGLHEWEDSRYIQISKGVGNLYGFRFNCRPEINLLRLGS